MPMNDRGMSFPMRTGSDHKLQTLDLNESVRVMLEQILFTAPGERVNRPTFGVGVQRAVFDPNGPFLENRIRAALDENVYQHLGRNVRIYNLDVEATDAELHITITFEVVDGVYGRQVVDMAVPLGVPR